MAKLPTQAPRNSAEAIGERILDISGRTSNQNDVNFLESNISRAPGDNTPVRPVIIEDDTPYPGKTVLVAEKDLYDTGKTQFLADFSSGSYFETEWLNQVVLYIGRKGDDAVASQRITQQFLDDMMDFLDSLPGVTPNPLPPDRFYNYLIGEYSCKQCY